MDDIRAKYEELFPETNWSEEEIIANFYRNSEPICESDEHIKYDYIFETEDEVNIFLKKMGAIPLDDFLNEVENKL